MVENEGLNIPVTGNELADGFSALEGTAIGEQYKLFQGGSAPVTPVKYAIVRQGVVTNQLAEIRSAQVPLDGSATAENMGFEFDFFKNTLTIRYGDIQVELENATRVRGLRTLTQILLQVLIMEFSKNENKENMVAIPLKEYMRLRGSTNAKKVRAQVQTDLETLGNLKLYFKEKGRGKKAKDKDYAAVSVIQFHSITNGVISVIFGNIFASIIRQYPIMYVPLMLYQVNPQQTPYAFNMAMKILELKRQNAGKANEDIIAVKTLLDCANFPRYEDIKSTGQIEQRIIEPFRKNLDAWSALFTWEFHRPKKETPTDESPDYFNYEVFSTSTVHIHWNYYPDMKKHLEAKKRTIRNAKRRDAYKRKKAEEKAQAEARQGSLI